VNFFQRKHLFFGKNLPSVDKVISTDQFEKHFTRMGICIKTSLISAEILLV
jgi:hypothetical protein